MRFFLLLSSVGVIMQRTCSLVCGCFGQEKFGDSKLKPECASEHSSSRESGVGVVFITDNV